MKYQQIELQSEKIEMNMDSSLVYATFGLDSIGEEFGYPLFKDGDQQYESKRCAIISVRKKDISQM